MLPPLFYISLESVSGEAETGQVVSLPTAEAKHLVKVMRLTAGALVILIDGLGMAYRAEVAKVGTKSVTARIHNAIRDFGEPTIRLTLAAGMSVGSKFDSVVQRGTELGVKRFIPLLTEKSKVALSDPKRARSRQNRLEKVALAAIKQCRRSCVPEIALPTTFEEFLVQHDSETPGLIFHAGEGAQSLDSLAFEPTLRRITLVVGPESGFSGDEVSRAVGAGFLQVGLGKRVLRTETAGPAVVALIMQRLGELS